MKMNVVIRRIDNGVIVTKERKERFYHSVEGFFEEISAGLDDELAKKDEYILSIETGEYAREACPKL